MFHKQVGVLLSLVVTLVACATNPEPTPQLSPVPPSFGGVVPSDSGPSVPWQGSVPLFKTTPVVARFEIIESLDVQSAITQTLADRQLLCVRREAEVADQPPALCACWIGPLQAINLRSTQTNLGVRKATVLAGSAEEAGPALMTAWNLDLASTGRQSCDMNRFTVLYEGGTIRPKP